jgi:hypothetical protein
MKKKLFVLMFFLIWSSSVGKTFAQSDYHEQNITESKEVRNMNDQKDTLAILWTSGDPDVALKMVFMYAKGAIKNDWWNSINLIIWGPSSKLTSENKEIQNAIKEMQQLGIVVYACKACADQYGVADKLKELGIDVKYMGEPLTDFLKSDAKVITF